ncbi:type II and III secretion system protein family protein [Sphingomonas sp. TREG-RG-20F-R18-01]|uniref:type II and III secretion system protein family protein n=1 Tax=Sphingomonas sp. TREG-RG-20F-R18-01 TaxID=2914982 RepID=UPI001F57E3AF|nr:type II and III secretion system protein family protein [Sphingomonas sp. TREG-RG-20F-R18-01]
MRSVSTSFGWSLAVALVAVSVGTLPAAAPAQTTAGTPVFQVNTGRGRLVTLVRPMSDVFVADDKIADVQVRSPTQLYIFGKGAGETTISATSKSGAVVYSATVRVGNNFDSIQQMLSLAMPEAKIVATPMNGIVLLTGTVAAPEDGAEATRLVQAFVGDGTKVLSRLGTATPLQVNLQVRIAEVSRSFVKNLGVHLSSYDGTNGFKFGVSQGREASTQYAPRGGLFTGGTTATAGQSLLTGLAGSTTFGAAGKLFGLDLISALDIGETDGQVSTLANPNITALSGETGSFLAGGEIPIPLSQGLGAVSVEFKQYGVSLSYTPTVLADGRISLRVRPEVSQLTSDGAVQISGTTIPALTTRRAETTVELGSGQSMMIAGLLQNSHNNTITKAPGVGDVPILGALFRSNAFQRNETELVIVVTPYLVKPVNANDIVLPTDGVKAPTDLDRVLFGQLGGGQTGGERPKPTLAPTGVAHPAFGGTTPSPGPQDQPRDGAVSALPADPPRSSGSGKRGATAAPGFSIN